MAANPPQKRNCSVYNETNYGNFEIGLTLAKHSRVFDESFEFLANLEPADDSPVICDGEIIFPKIPAYDINEDFWSYIYTGDSNAETFHRMFIRQRNFDTLCTEIINPCNFEDLPAKVKEALNRGKKFESRAGELCIDVMRLKLRHFVLVHETGLVIQPSLFG